MARMRIQRSLPAVACFAFSALSLLCAATAAVAADKGDYDRALALFQERDYAGAIALMDPYIRAHPTDPRALVLRGDARASLDDDIGALKDYDAAIAANPDYQYAYATRCDTRQTTGDLRGALTDCDTALKLDGQDSLAYEYRGNVYFAEADYDAALADYQHSIELGRATATIYADRCNAERLAGKIERAPADCERALAIDPQSRDGLWARGRLLLTQNHYEGAVADLSAYIAQKPKTSDNAYYFRGYAYNRMKKFSLALADEQTYIDRHAQDADAHAERAIARYNLGDKAGASADLEVALKGYREDSDAQAVARVQALIAAANAGGSLP
jgi:regulator of sirC expression with transglutaminase-like and TPR domain